MDEQEGRAPNEPTEGRASGSKLSTHVSACWRQDDIAKGPFPHDLLMGSACMHEWGPSPPEPHAPPGPEDARFGGLSRTDPVNVQSLGIWTPQTGEVHENPPGSRIRMLLV
jgi:hypothetical protein